MPRLSMPWLPAIPVRSRVRFHLVDQFQRVKSPLEIPERFSTYRQPDIIRILRSYMPHKPIALDQIHHVAVLLWRSIAFLMAATACATTNAGQPVLADTQPGIIKVTSATNPALNRSGAAASSYMRLMPRSLATIWGTNLSADTRAATAPWPKTLSGVQVHVIINQYTPCANPSQSALPCDLTADVLFASPTQINFVVPDVSPAAYGQSQLNVRIALVRDGVTFDNLGFNWPGGFYGGGTFIIDASIGFDTLVVGYDCLFFSSAEHPGSCGVSTAGGANRAALGGLTDSAGNLITAQNPVYQGRQVVLWGSGLPKLKLQASGLLSQSPPDKVTFSYRATGSLSARAPTLTATPQWAGESPQFVGLDQINLVFPKCTGAPATVERRYSVYIPVGVLLISGSSLVQTTIAPFDVPFAVRVGDPDCPAPPLN
jgi:hypothetical protein